VTLICCVPSCVARAVPGCAGAPAASPLPTARSRADHRARALAGMPAYAGSRHQSALAVECSEMARSAHPAVAKFGFTLRIPPVPPAHPSAFDFDYLNGVRSAGPAPIGFGVAIRRNLSATFHSVTAIAQRVSRSVGAVDPRVVVSYVRPWIARARKIRMTAPMKPAMR
jgi:hypothetical protein